MNINTMLGLKLYRYIEENDDFEIVRITRILGPEKVKISSNKEPDRKVLFQDLVKEYTVIKSIGVLTFSIVKVKENYDVIVTLTRKADIETGLSAPYVICRQSVTDFFYSILASDVEHPQVGVSASVSTCPPNIEYSSLLLCDTIELSDIVNMYYDDTIDSILECVRVLKFNEVLYSLYEKHVKSIGKPILLSRDYYNGWTTTLKSLLVSNNFWIDVNSAFNITDVDFDLNNHIITKSDNNNQEYYSLDKDILSFLSNTFKLNMVDSIVIEYDYDIDFSEYRNSNYVLIRDKIDKLYLVVYIISGVYLEQDIAIQKEANHLMDQYRLKIYNKYSK